MTYRRKLPSVAQLNPLCKLKQLCNLAALELPFQLHNAEVLLEQLKVYNSTIFEQFTKNATRQGFIPGRVVKAHKAASVGGDGVLIAGASEFRLPLPKYFIDPLECQEDIVQRVFYHSSMVKRATGVSEESYAPRCGLTGLFFSREEVVDNLQAAATDLGFSSPFWIRSDNSALGDFLQLKDGSEAICLSLTTAVTSIEEMQPFHEDILHPRLRRAVGSKGLVFGKDVPLGMNAISGFVTKNPFVQQLPNRGVWFSKEQVFQNKLRLKKKGDTAKSSFVLVEIEQWEMHNADQLCVPGRLALRRHESKNTDGFSIFV